jgi:hypothetical protein
MKIVLVVGARPEFVQAALWGKAIFQQPVKMAAFHSCVLRAETAVAIFGVHHQCDGSADHQRVGEFRLHGEVK